MGMNKIYKKIAKKHNTTVEEVKRQMESAVNSAYKNKDKTASVSNKQAEVPSKGQVPTIADFINHAAKAVKEKE